jgi:hypothetical protein
VRAGIGAPQRRVILIAAAIEGALKIAMLADLRGRDQSQIRGPKWLWATLTVVNSAGLIPLGYFLLGRQPGRHRAHGSGDQ